MYVSFFYISSDYTKSAVEDKIQEIINLLEKRGIIILGMMREDGSEKKYVVSFKENIAGLINKKNSAFYCGFGFEIPNETNKKTIISYVVSCLKKKPILNGTILKDCDVNTLRNLQDAKPVLKSIGNLSMNNISF